MTDREKMLELIAIGGFFSRSADAEKCVDYLIANGVAPVVHGRWDDFCNGKMCCCSACKAEFDNACNEIHGEWKFCPNCSAKMDGGVSDG